MAVYKGVEIDAELVDLIRHMRDVEDYREVLGRLQSGWDTLTLMGQLTGAAADMSGTREAFEQLTGDLLNQLGQETRRKVVSDLACKAQNGVDVLVRNLFERTADIGFLAADREVAGYLERGAAPAERAAIENRFREYVAKYSVYSDIVLLDREGFVRARLQPHPAESTDHPLCAEAATTGAAYVEFFGEWNLLPPGRRLVYAYRVTDARGALRGVLALVFRLDDEMASIYGNLVAESDWTILTAVSPEGEILATSSPLQAPVGARLPRVVLSAKGDVVRFAGRVYLAVAAQPTPYQGYRGPGWLGVALAPVESAFDGRDSRLLQHVDPGLLEGLMHGSTVFKNELRAIPDKAGSIQAGLNRSVWNGSVRKPDREDYNAAFTKTLLWEISNVGRKTQQVFEQSIVNLHETVIAEVLQGALAKAAFSIDVMDRNLYERANDCRWWALTSTFGQALASRDPAALDACGPALRAINGLYTVYSNLLLFDASGVVVAVSNPEEAGLVGQRLEDEWVGRTIGLRSTQDYVVSPFGPSPLYGDRPTYVYAAAVRGPGGTKPVGGIGVVFDSEPQFAAMLADAIPRASDGTAIDGAFALFVRRNGAVVASSTEAYATDVPSGLRSVVAALPPGGSSCQIVEMDGVHYALGAVMSAGYREYKISDGHRDDVAAVCAAPIAVGQVERKPAKTRAAARTHVRVQGVETIGLATFHVGRHWFGVPAASVIEAVDCSDFTPTPRASSGAVVGYKRYKGELSPLVRLDRLLGLTESTAEPTQAVLLRVESGPPIGLLVDMLGDVPEIPAGDVLSLQDHEALRNGFATSVAPSMAREDGGTGMLTLLNLERILRLFAPDRAGELRRIA